VSETAQGFALTQYRDRLAIGSASAQKYQLFTIWRLSCHYAAAMVRISVTRSSQDAITYLVEGKLEEESCHQLANLRETAHNGQTFTLDLSGVLFIDRYAVSFLHELKSQGVMIAGCSGFVAEQLKSAERQ
jgi:ABC-type transporter Mla MlaB component